MQPKSHTLFHFTKGLDTLKAILSTGFWPRYCVEDVSWQFQDPIQSGHVAFPIVCFCDIPLSRIDEHVGFYGDFGIGMTREWAVTNGVNPLMYVASHNGFARAMNQITGVAQKSKAKAVTTTLIESLRHVAMHMKPSIGQMVVSGQPVEKDFYQESEWRYVAQHESIRNFIQSNQLPDEHVLGRANESTKKHCMLRFMPRDVRYLFVRSDADIPALVNFIQTDLDMYPSADLKILMSRITSLESIRSDW